MHSEYKSRWLSRERLGPAFGPAAIGALALFFALSYLVTRTTYVLPIFEDLAEIRPYRRMVFEAFSAGRFPLWAPSLLCGLPLASFAHSSAFYPLGFIFGVWEFNTAAVINLYLHLAIFGWGMYVLMRALAIERPAASVAAAMTTFGPMNSYLQLCFLPTVYTAAWAPWLFAFALLALSRPRLLYMIGMAAAFMLQVLGGRYDLITRELVLLLGIAVAMAAVRRERLKVVGLWLAAGLAGTLAAGVMPMHYEYFHHSIRSLGLGFDYFASFQGDSQTLLLGLFWFSFPSVIVALAGLPRAARRPIVIGAALVFFVSLLWVWSPGWWLHVNYLLPVLKNEVWSNVMVVFMFMAGGVLAGEGIGAWGRRGEGRGAVRAMVVIVLAAAAGFVIVRLLIRSPGPGPNDISLATGLLLRGRTISAIGLAAGTLVLWAWVRRRMVTAPAGTLMTIFALMAAVDVLGTSWLGAVRKQHFDFPKTPIAIPPDKMGHQPYRSVNLFHFGDWQNLRIPVQAGSEPGMRSFDGFISLPPRRLGEFLALAAPKVMTVKDGKLAGERFMSTFKEDGFIDGRAMRLMSFMNTGWFVAGGANIKFGSRYFFRWAARPGLGFLGDWSGTPNEREWQQRGAGCFYDTVALLPGSRFQAGVAVAGKGNAWVQMWSPTEAGGGSRLFFSRAMPGLVDKTDLDLSMRVDAAVSASVRFAGLPVNPKDALEISWHDPALVNDSQPLKFVGADDGSAVYWNPSAMRLLFPVHAARAINDAEQRLTYLEAHPESLGTEAVLEREAPGPLAESDTRQERVVPVIYEDQRLTFDSELVRPGLVVMSEAWYPGWRARMDSGYEVPVLRADHAFRAVWVPDGRHRVTLTFEPASFRVGLWAALATLAAGLAVLAGRGVRKMRVGGG